MKLRAAGRGARARIAWRYCVIPLASLLMVMALSACPGGNKKPSCTGDSENYKGRCLPHTTARYLECIRGLSFSLSKEMSGGATLPAVANSTFMLAYKQSKEEDSTVALQIVHDCFALAEQNATSATDRGAAREYVQQTTRYIRVFQRRLPAIELDPSGKIDCGAVDTGAQLICQNITIKSTGVVALRVSRVEVTGTDSEDFDARNECVGKSFDPDQSCTMTVRFQPSAPGERNATLIIRQNIPLPDRGTPLQLVGTGNPAPGGHNLAVTVDTSAAPGGVTSSPPGIDCRDSCTGTFDDGTDVTLTANYNQGTGQVTWEGCDTTSGDNCALQLTKDRAVTAHLSP